MDQLSVNAVAMRRKELDRQRKEYERFQQAADLLLKDAKNAEANLIVGRYHCFGKGNWTAGLPRLVLGKDARLRELASRDLAGPTSAAELVALGDGWWSVAEIEKRDPARTHLLRRAHEHYQQALPGLSGPEKTRVEKRLADLKKFLGAAAGPTSHSGTARGALAMALVRID
jgi:hypothetical protein